MAYTNYLFKPKIPNYIQNHHKNIHKYLKLIINKKYSTTLKIIIEKYVNI